MDDVGHPFTDRGYLTMEMIQQASERVEDDRKEELEEYMDHDVAVLEQQVECNVRFIILLNNFHSNKRLFNPCL